MADHSPAPWTAICLGNYVHVEDADGETVSDIRLVWGYGLPNARLIAAAPNLLASSKGMLKHIDDVLDDDDLMQRRAALVAAIRLADGQS